MNSSGMGDENENRKQSSPSSPPGIHVPREGSVKKMPLSTGLSALIQAATSQFGQLVEDDSSPAIHCENGSKTVHSTGTNKKRDVAAEADPYAGVTTDDGASSDGGEKPEDANQHTHTPVIVPEPDPTKQTLPQLLMTLAVDESNSDIIAFLPDGKFFALRVKDFTETIMKEVLSVTTFEEFLDLTNEWGFTRILPQDQNDTGIEVFRHPQFVKGEFARCKKIKCGKNATNARVSGIPQGSKIEYTVSDDSGNSSATANPKRRLSPGFLKRQESESSATLKKRHSLEGGSGNHAATAAAAVRAESENGDVASYTNHSRSDDIRSVALAVTTEKLNLHADKQLNGTATGEAPPPSLVDQAVKSATHTIVADAIEILLQDESHTKEMYQKHEKELSKSSLPGVVPISKILFDDAEGGRRLLKTKPDSDLESLPKEVITRRTSGIEQLSAAAAIKSEELREESERAARRASLNGVKQKGTLKAAT